MILDNYTLIHMFCGFFLYNFRGRTPPLNKTDYHMSMKIHMQMKPSSTHHALSIHLNNTPHLVKICSVVLEIKHTVVSE